MALIVKATGNGQKTPEGTHVARCIQVVDMGTAMQDGYQGAPPAKKHQIFIGWELPDLPANEDGKPPIHWQWYNFTLHEMSTLRPHLEGWRGRSFTQEELNGFDLGNVLGKTCMLSVTNNDNGKPRVNGITPVDKRIDVPPAAHDPLFFSISDTSEPVDMEAFNRLREPTQERIKESDEWKSRMGDTPPSPQPIAEDEIPF